jgi:hypothetical protein
MICNHITLGRPIGVIQKTQDDSLMVITPPPEVFTVGLKGMTSQNIHEGNNI